MDRKAAAADDIDQWVRVAEHADGQRLADPIFRRRYREPAPDFPIHVLAHCRTADGDWLPACYIHITVSGTILLGGGVCVDDRVLRRLPFAARRSLHAVGGLYQHTLRWSLQHFGPRCRAMFGYCGDVLAERADLAVGFEKTRHPHLLIYCPAPLPDDEREALVAIAHAASPF
jgi:hypothetical protein